MGKMVTCSISMIEGKSREDLAILTGNKKGETRGFFFLLVRGEIYLANPSFK